MANNQIEKWKHVQRNPKIVSRTQPRKVYPDGKQANSFGLLQVIPNCPKCGQEHSFVVISRVSNRDKRVKDYREKPVAEQRKCTKCGFSSSVEKTKKPKPPTLDQVEYANHLLISTYQGCKERYKLKYPKNEPSKDIKAAWLRKAKTQAYKYLCRVTEGFPIDKLYPHLVQ